jgi:hypothetical protein
MPSRSEVALIYVIGLVQGLALVTFPAASSIFTTFHTIYSWGSVLGVAMFGVAFAVRQLRRPVYERQHD